mmetsp:Transcript_369/g.447  ORF Transcript_369/g.447 Transcript_369/m.447 type:complete len:228 (+) Transcript_369:206-889(+)
MDATLEQKSSCSHLAVRRSLERRLRGGRVLEAQDGETGAQRRAGVVIIVGLGSEQAADGSARGRAVQNLVDVDRHVSLEAERQSDARVMGSIVVSSRHGVGPKSAVPGTGAIVGGHFQHGKQVDGSASAARGIAARNNAIVAADITRLGARVVVKAVAAKVGGNRSVDISIVDGNDVNGGVFERVVEANVEGAGTCGRRGGKLSSQVERHRVIRGDGGLGWTPSMGK